MIERMASVIICKDYFIQGNTGMAVSGLLISFPSLQYDCFLRTILYASQAEFAIAGMFHPFVGQAEILPGAYFGADATTVAATFIHFKE